MSRQIYCVKVCQRRLEYMRRSSSFFPYFPYDRFYLVKKIDASLVPRMFPYCFEMALTPALLLGLNALRVDATRTIPQYRDDAAFAYKCDYDNPPMLNAFADLIQDCNEWLLVAPTHTTKQYLPTQHKQIVAQHINYIHSTAIALSRQGVEDMPLITLHTPTRTIALFCAICDRILDYQEGKCAPGNSRCDAVRRLRAEIPAERSAQ